MSGVLAALAALLREEGGLLGAAVGDPAPGGADGPAEHAAAGPRSADDPAGVALLVAAVHEGQRLHAGDGTVVENADADLALLAGDRLYALGLERLAARGDLEAVAALADVIAGCARAQAVGDPALAAAAWERGAQAVGWGPQSAPSAGDAP